MQLNSEITSENLLYHFTIPILHQLPKKKTQNQETKAHDKHVVLPLVYSQSVVLLEGLEKQIRNQVLSRRLKKKPGF